MFEITIKEIKIERRIVGGQYTVIDRRPYTDNELRDSLSWMRSDACKKGDTKPIYGYAPDREQEGTSEREIFRQTVEDLDLPAVIKAINQL